MLHASHKQNIYIKKIAVLFIRLGVKVRFTWKHRTAISIAKALYEIYIYAVVEEISLFSESKV